MHLKQMGIPAAVLNSMQDTAEQSRLMMNARAGQYRLVYLSPERLAKEDTIGWLRGVPFRSSPSTRPTAFPSGDTNSAPIIAS